jgi:hypothetical protein
MNLKSQRHKVVASTINCFWRKHRFQFTTILKLWFKVDTSEALIFDVPFMCSNAYGICN